MTVLSLTWESSFLGKTVFYVETGPCFQDYCLLPFQLLLLVTLTYHRHTEAKTFCRRHCQIHFLVWKLSYFHSNFTESPIMNIPALIQIIWWFNLLTQMFVTPPQGVNITETNNIQSEFPQLLDFFFLESTYCPSCEWPLDQGKPYKPDIICQNQTRIGSIKN